MSCHSFLASRSMRENLSLFNGRSNGWCDAPTTVAQWLRNGCAMACDAMRVCSTARGTSQRRGMWWLWRTPVAGRHVDLVEHLCDDVIIICHQVGHAVVPLPGKGVLVGRPLMLSAGVYPAEL